MTHKLGLLAALSLIVATAACQPTAENRVTSADDIEEITGDDVDGDGTVPEGGVEQPAESQ